MFSVIFEVHPRDGRHDDYLAHAKALKPEIEAVDGFIDNERFASRTREGWVLSHSTWRDEKSVIRWRTQAKHHLTQETGRFEIFSDYHLRVGEITSDSRPPAGVPVREQRFDATEVGRAKLCTLLELVPADGTDLPKDGSALLRAVALDPVPAGLDSVEAYDSIYNPGKVLVLGSWSDEKAGQAYRPGQIAGAKSIRLRSVRVIRDYGMYDRRETPQYYPEVAPQAG